MRHLVRPAARALVLGLLAVGVMGMGSFGGNPDGGLPARDYRATFVDVDGTRMEVSRVTAGGDTNLDGELGRGRLRISFDNVARVTMQPSEERDRVNARVELREGEPVTLSLRTSTTFYGQTPAGAYQIRARDLKAVEFK
jgi:hypothetical protein